MINIDVRRAKRRVTVNVKGHANAAAKGEDIVCAAVSVLVLTLQQTLTREKAKGLKCRLSPGDAHISFMQDKWSKPIMHTVMCGFDFLADMYPQYIRLHAEAI